MWRTADDLKLIAEDLYIEQHPISWYQFLEAFTVREAGRPAPLSVLPQGVVVLC